jgi:hypothetical protein
MPEKQKIYLNLSIEEIELLLIEFYSWLDFIEEDDEINSQRIKNINYLIKRLSKYKN